MKQLNFELKNLCRANRDGSYATQATRFKLLQQIANDLPALGYKHMKAGSLKDKHVAALVEHYTARDLSISTIKNRLAAIRWWAGKVGKPHIANTDNERYGIPARRYLTNTSKAVRLDTARLAAVPDAHVRMSLELQKAFGLRREEAIKFIPAHADQGNHIRLKPTWTKGGKSREIPVRTEAQRDVLRRARALAGNGSLIPPERNYIHQLRVYEKQTQRAGLSKLHGLRHLYAQERYEELTGWKAPNAGGPSSWKLTQAQWQVDHEARLTASRELGHERESITAAYLGR